MKKACISVFLVLCIYGAAFSYEAWLQAGFGYGNYWEKEVVEGENVKAYIGSPGFGINNYQFWNNIGFFIDTTFSFPNAVQFNIDGYNYNFQFGFMVGPAFKLNVTENMKIRLGVGFSSLLTMGDYNNETLFNHNLGVGSDVSFAYRINDLFYITIGTLTQYQFLNRRNIPTPTSGGDDHEENHVWSKNYSMFGIRPYISFGCIFKTNDK